MLFRSMYSKQARVESMTYLSHDETIRLLTFEDSNHSRIRLAPQFYLKKWVSINEITSEHTLEQYIQIHPPTDTANVPDYFLFFEKENLKERVANAKKYYPNLRFSTFIDQGFIDDLLHRMNPDNNVNQVIYIYKVK